MKLKRENNIEKKNLGSWKSFFGEVFWEEVIFLFINLVMVLIV